MKSLLFRMSVVGLTALTWTSAPALGHAAEPRPVKEISFGVLKAPSAEQARASALEWLKSVNADDATLSRFEAAWADANRPLLDKVADTLALGRPEAARLLAEARNADGPAPTEVPFLLLDKKQDAFYRNNLALAYGKALAGRRIYEDALEAFKAVKVEQVVDPAAFYFHKAVCEHGLMRKADATKTIARLLEDGADAPERYKMVAALMIVDMKDWQEKGLGPIGQLMGAAARRLDVGRGGPQTQKIEAEIIRRLDEEINRHEPPPPPPSPPSPPWPTPPSPTPSLPGGGNNISGPGEVDPKHYKDESKAWGALPEKERAKAMMKRVSEMPASHRKMIEEYYKKVASEGVK